MTRAIRFATQTGGQPGGAEWAARATRIEAMGYATLSMPDHMVGDAWAAMPALAAAAGVTTTLRLGTLVVDNDFRNPVVLAREAATLDVISDGRFELGIGAGWFDRDYLGTGIPFDRGRVRVARLAEAVRLMKRLFTEERVDFAGDFYRVERAESRPRTVQRPHPPFLIAGAGRQLLGLCGREADIVAIVPPGIGTRELTPHDVSVEKMREQIGVVRDAAGARFERIELSMFLDCVLTDDRERTIAEVAAAAKADPAVIRWSAYRGIGTLAQIGAHIRALRDALGITYFCLRGPDVERLGPVVRELAGM